MSISCIDFCKALSDDTRQKMLKMLQEREMCVGDIVESFSLSQPTVSHHLNILKNIGLVKSRKEGKLVFYSINQDNVDECCGMIVAKFSCGES